MAEAWFGEYFQGRREYIPVGFGANFLFATTLEILTEPSLCGNALRQ